MHADDTPDDTPDDAPAATPLATPIDARQAAALLGTAAWLDVRDEASFASGHLPGAGNVPLQDWTERRHELPPPRDGVIAIADDAAHAREAAQQLATFGYRDVAWLDAPWRSMGVAASREPAKPLWRPAPFLERVLPAIPRGGTLDVACGAGRDAVFLARNGFEVEAWDRDTGALARADALAARNGVHLRTVTVNLEAAVAPAFAEAKYALILCFRYLHRPLFPLLMHALAPGGHLVYETFREGQERYGHPRRPRFLLYRGELREAFAALELLEYEESEPAGGPVMARLHARKPQH